MFVLSLFKLRVGTALSADWMRPYALGQRLYLGANFVKLNLLGWTGSLWASSMIRYLH